MGVAVADGLIGLAVDGPSPPGPPTRDTGFPVLAGMAGAAFLDLDKPSTVFFGFSPFPRAVDRIHGRIQHEAPHRMPQEILVGIMGALGVAALTRRARRRS